MSEKVKAGLCVACVRSCLLCGSETWALLKEGQRRVERTENSTVHKMSGIKEGVPVEKIREKDGNN